MCVGPQRTLILNGVTSRSGMKSQLLSLFIEIALIVASELLMRPFSVSCRYSLFTAPVGGRRTRGHRTLVRNKVILLMTQCCILSLFIFVLYMYHHVAYILIVAALFICGRALWMNQMSSTKNDTPYSCGIVVSKPLWAGSNTETFNLPSTNNPYRTQSTGTARFLTLKEYVPYDGSSVESVSAHSNESTEDYPSAIGEEKPWENSKQAEMSNEVYISHTTPPGLLNTGNSCFVNSILQCLTWTPGFFGLLANLPSDLSNKESIFLDNLKNIVGLCRSFPDGRTVISTDELLLSMSLLSQHLVASRNSLQHQQDAAEFLLWLLNHLHTASRDSSCKATYSKKRTQDLKMSKIIDEEMINAIGSKDIRDLEAPMMDLSKVDWELHWQQHSSALNDLFMGQLLEARECQSCNKVTMSSEYFTLLPLPLKEGSSLTECINMFSKSEELVQDNKISCSCSQGGSNATRLALLSVVPKCLVIQLTRFSYDSSLHAAVKNNTTVRLLSELEVFPYTMRARFNSKHQHMLYNLHAVCVHSGGQRTSCGHYVAYCRVHGSQWYHFNDDIVTLITDIDRELTSDFVLRNAYILLYHRVD